MSAPEPEEEPEPPPGRIRPTGPGPLVLTGLGGMVAGWAVRPLCLQLGLAEPHVSLLSVALLFFAAAILGGTAYLTRRTVRRDRFALDSDQAVNRLVFAKACALVGVLLAGGYLGYAVGQLGVDEPAATTRLWRSCLGALGAATVTGAALLLEHACRVPRPRD